MTMSQGQGFFKYISCLVYWHTDVQSAHGFGRTSRPVENKREKQN